MRRGSIVQLILIGTLAGGVATALALIPDWLPRPASDEAGRIDFVFWFVTGICIFIFALVSAVIVYSVLHFRAKPEDDSDGPPTHGHTGLEIAWTAVPTILVTAIGIVSAIVLAKDDAAGANPLRVDVTAQQFAWTYSYPQYGNKKATVLRLPVNRSVVLRMTSKDVIHSFWVPEFRQKQDLVPGIHPTLHITPNRVGSYSVICTELCGLGHALMRSRAVVMEQGAFTAWVKGGGGQSQGSGSLGQASKGGLAAFSQYTCNSCHALKAAGSQAVVGPDLDKLRAEAQRAGKPLDAFVRESIMNPNAYVEPGFAKGLMPQDFGTQIPKATLDQLVQYLVANARKG